MLEVLKENCPSDDPPLVDIVDDDASVVVALGRLLRSWGMQARTFATGEAFLSAARKSPAADCLVLDVQMPGIKGLEVQARLKQAGLDLPIIFITGHEVEGEEEQARKAGAIGFLRKPFSEDTLIAMILRSLQKRRKNTVPCAEKLPEGNGLQEPSLE